MTFQLLTVIAAFLLNCSSRSDVKTADDTNDSLAKTDTLRRLYGNQTLHYFSNNLDKDTFKISVLGKSIVSGQINLEIIDKNGHSILKESFLAFDPLELSPNATIEQKIQFIKGRIDKFFQEEAFRKPAIGSKDLFIDDYSRKEIWDEIKADTSLIGFSYSAGYEDGRQIAYSKKLKSAVIYFECC